MKKTIFLSVTLLTLPACSQAVELDIKIIDLTNVEIHTEMQREFFAQEEYDYVDLNPFVNGRKNQGDNLPIEISWNTNTNVVDELIYKVAVSENGGQTFNLTSTTSSASFINYKLNTTYKVDVSTTYKGTEYKAPSIEFKTPKDVLRTITVEGIPNFRDLGSYGKIKQGYIYRSMTFENNTISGIEPVTENSVKTLKELGIKSEIDLRKSDERGSDKGTIEGIIYKFFPLYYGGKNILTYSDSDFNNPEMIKQIFEYLSEDTSYPAVFHCVRGTDRTGCIAYLIEGLLGLEEEYLKRDFIYSNFYNIGSPVRFESIENVNSPQSTGRYVNVLKNYEGEKLSDKIFNYLNKVIGVEEQKLNKIISILGE